MQSLLGDQASSKDRAQLIRQARLVTYISIATTVAGGFSGLAAALLLDRSGLSM